MESEYLDDDGNIIDDDIADSEDSSKRKTRYTKFQFKWLEGYGLRILETDASGQPSKLICRFCEKFGRSNRPDETNRKRRKRSSNREYTEPWRTDRITEHLKHDHLMEFMRYKALPLENQKYFFGQSSARSTDSVTEYKEPISPMGDMIFRVVVDVEIVKKVLSHNLFTDDFQLVDIDLEMHKPLAGCFDEKVIQVNGVHRAAYDMSAGTYAQYQLMNKLVGHGLTCSMLVEVFKEMNKLCKDMPVVSDNEMVSHCVKLFCGESLSIIGEALRKTWGFVITSTITTHLGYAYLDFGVRFSINNEMFDMHLLAIPLTREIDTDEVTHDLKMVLDIIHPNWTKTLLGFHANGGGNFEKHCQAIGATVAQFVEHQQFIGVWSGKCKLASGVHEAFNLLVEGTLLDTLEAIVLDLRQEDQLMRMIGSVCPCYSSHAWLPMGDVVEWLVSNYQDIEEFVRSNSTVSKNIPNVAVFWITISRLLPVLETVDQTWKTISANNLMVNRILEQFQTLGEYLVNITQIMKDGDESSACRMDYDHDDEHARYGPYSVKLQTIRDFIVKEDENITEKVLNALSEDELSNLVLNFSLMLLKLVHLVESLQEECKQKRVSALQKAIANIGEIPSSPSAVSKLSPHEFRDIVLEQQTRLNTVFHTKFNSQDLVTEFMKFQQKYKDLPEFQKLPLEKLDTFTSVGVSWGHIALEFPHLMEFCFGFSCLSSRDHLDRLTAPIVYWQIEHGQQQFLSRLLLQGMIHSGQKEEFVRLQRRLQIAMT